MGINLNHNQTNIASETLSDCIIESAPVGIVTVNSNLEVTRFNRWATLLTGYSEEEALGRFCGDVLHGGMCSATCPLKTALECKKPVIGLETTIKNKEGKTIPVRMSTAGLFGDEGQLIGGVEIFQDMSYIKTLEQERNNFVSMLAHDLKSPVITIHGFAHRLLLKQPEMETQRKYLEIIEKEASRLETLISDFLEFSRLQTGRLKLNVSATSVDKELYELYDFYFPRAAQKGLRLEFRSDKPLPLIQADSTQLHRVFSNLLDNAVKFSMESGTITISTEETDQEIAVSIEDQGTGIDPADLPFIFDVFRRGHNDTPQEGFGLGLASAKAIVEGHGGRITVDSMVGEGSRFTVRLPKFNVKIRLDVAL